MAELMDVTTQVVLIHLSDVHFGTKHRFNPPTSPAGDVPEEPHYPDLLGKLSEDLLGPDPGCPVVVCMTGDLVETAHVHEFGRLEEFIKGLADTAIFGRKRGLESIKVVPGNHDVFFNSDEIGVRWQQWTEFHNRMFGTNVVRENPWAFAQVHDLSEDAGLILACLNSSIYVQKEKPDEDRGRLDIKQLSNLEDQLDAIPAERLFRSIRVAIIHHHPILLPPLAEPGRGYDAVHNSGKLLAILRRYGFHAVLHGHKHNPHTFTDDTRPAHQDTSAPPILIAAGGSVGSTSLPTSPGIANCYNQVTIKWHPEARQTRVRVETRGLSTFNDDGTEILITRWKWFTMRVDDRHFLDLDRVPVPKAPMERDFSPDLDGAFEEARKAEYERTRGNLPVVEVIPSLDPTQAYEAILWIETHPFGEAQPEEDKPTQVTWSAGNRFEVVTVERDLDPKFAASLEYYGPMLVQARIQFPDGEALSYIYVRMPASFEIGAA